MFHSGACRGQEESRSIAGIALGGWWCAWFMFVLRSPFRVANGGLLARLDGDCEAAGAVAFLQKLLAGGVCPPL